MATENRILDLAFPAAEDLTGDQYKFLVLAPDGTVRRPDADTEAAVGILQNAPAAGDAAAVRVLGVSKLHAAEALAVGAFATIEFVSAADAGKGKTAATVPDYTRALVIEAAAAEDDLASVLLT
jgi:hypothetical protein